MVAERRTPMAKQKGLDEILREFGKNYYLGKKVQLKVFCWQLQLEDT